MGSGRLWSAYMSATIPAQIAPTGRLPIPTGMGINGLPWLPLFRKRSTRERYDRSFRKHHGARLRWSADHGCRSIATDRRGTHGADRNEAAKTHGSMAGGWVFETTGRRSDAPRVDRAYYLSKMAGKSGEAATERAKPRLDFFSKPSGN